MATTAKKKVATKKNSSEKNDKELIKLKQEIDSLKQMLVEASNNNSNKNSSPIQFVERESDRDVLFISLCLGILNLSTGGLGNGEIYTFSKFGEEQVIPLSDAKLIIKNNKSFITGGKVYIDDQDLIESMRLTKVYENILDEKGLNNLFKEDIKTFEKVFKGIPYTQQVCFKDILTQKVIKGENIDKNLIFIVNETLKVDILKSVEDGKNIIE